MLIIFIVLATAMYGAAACAQSLPPGVVVRTDQHGNVTGVVGVTKSPTDPYKYFTVAPTAKNMPQIWKWTLPPVEYDRYYDGLELIIRIADDLLFECGLPRETTMGCAKPRGNTCTIILREDAFIRSLGWTTAIVLRHEMAHCNGWPSNHPGLRHYSSGQPTASGPAYNPDTYRARYK